MTRTNEIIVRLSKRLADEAQRLETADANGQRFLKESINVTAEILYEMTQAKPRKSRKPKPQPGDGDGT